MRKGNSEIEILIVEDSPTQALQLQYMLEMSGYGTSIAKNGNEGLQQIGKSHPQLIISDITMPEMNGWDFCRTVKSTEEMKNIPVILLTSLSEPQDILTGLKCGADSFLIKPPMEEPLLSRVNFILANQELRESQSGTMSLDIFFSGEKHHITPERIQIINLLFTTFENTIKEFQELERINCELKMMQETLIRQAEEMKALSLRDDLTGLYNLRGFMMMAEQQKKTALREKQSIRLFFFDVDGLKRINNDFGHMTGNMALKDSARIIGKTFRDMDIQARIGGDEFVVMAIVQAAEPSSEMIDRLNENLKEFAREEERDYKLSLNAGTAICDPESLYSIEELLHQADKELCRIKRSK